MIQNKSSQILTAKIQLRVFCQTVDQSIQKVKADLIQQPAAQPRTLAQFRALQMHSFSATCTLIIFLQLVNPLDSFLFVLHASRSIFIKGISSLINHVVCFSICFCDFFCMFCLLSCQYLQHLENERKMWFYLQKRIISIWTMQNEMKQVSETVYKNGTFIATERSCT